MAIWKKWAAAGAVIAYLGTSAIAAYPAGGMAYDVQFKGTKGDIGDAMRAASRLESGQDAPPAGIAGLEQRGEGDRETFIAILRSQGYYDGTVDVVVDQDSDPVKVTVNVERGPRYPIAQCKIIYSRPPPKLAPTECPALDLQPNAPARSLDIINASTKLVRALNEHGRPDAQITKREAIVDHLTKTMRLTFTVDPGREARFGDLQVSGVKRTNPAFLSRIVTWEKGAIYDVRKVDDYRKRLGDLNLFSTLDIKPQTDKESANGEVPIALSVSERKPRTIGGGVRYATNEGPGLKVFWEHRNFWGEAQDLRINLGIATIEQSLETILTLPHQPDVGQTLSFGAKLAREDTDAYEKMGGTLSAQLATPLGGHWSGKAGVQLDVARLKQSSGSAFNVLLSLPVEALYDSTKAPLDPKKGERLSVRAQPVGGISDGARAFLILQSEASIYRALDTDQKFVAAGRLKIGTILFASKTNVPADFRFYGGGGGSVRGFGYQAIGPRDALNKPLGGRAIAEASAELRYRINQDYGVAGFVDAGTVASNPAFKHSDTPRVGAGVGFRYYTGLGPLRLDVATPLNPRPGDGRIQVYISLGQAF